MDHLPLAYHLSGNQTYPDAGIAGQVRMVGALPLAGLPIHPLIGLLGKFPAQQRTGACIGHARQQRMVLVVGIPSHGKHPKISVQHANGPGRHTVDDVFHQGLLADGRGAIHRPPSGTQCDATDQIVCHHHAHHRPVCFAVLIAGPRIELQQFLGMGQREGRSVQQKGSPAQSRQSFLVLGQEILHHLIGGTFGYGFG